MTLTFEMVITVLPMKCVSDSVTNGINFIFMGVPEYFEYFDVQKYNPMKLQTPYPMTSPADLTNQTAKN